MAHPNEDGLRGGYDAFSRGDLEALRTQFLTSDVVWHQPGDSPISGDFSGVDETLGLFGRLFEISGGTFRVEIHDVLANESHGVVLGHVSGQREDRTLDQNYVHVSHMRDGKIAESWIHNLDQDEFDSFFS